MKTGLILEGGAMRGMFTAGVLDVLMEQGITVDGMVGVSAGAVFGCNYKSHQIGRTIRYSTTYCNDKRYASFRGLLDGGVADSIPIRFFESIGYKRNLIILTQPKGFVKKKNPMLPAIRARYLRYPAFVEAVADRHERYNETLSYISMLEQSGKDYVIRPPIPLEIGAMERDPDQLRRVYETGRAVAQIQVDKIRAFLETAKAEAEE